MNADGKITTAEVMEAYSRIFSTDDGKIVLADILARLGYFSNTPESIKPECLAVANTILSRLGLLNSSGVGIYMEGISYSINMAIAMKSKPVNEEDNDDN